MAANWITNDLIRADPAPVGHTYHWSKSTRSKGKNTPQIVTAAFQGVAEGDTNQLQCITDVIDGA